MWARNSGARFCRCGRFSDPELSDSIERMKSILYIGAGAPWLGGAGFLVRQRMFLRALSEVAELHLALFDLPARAEATRPAFVRTLTSLPNATRIHEGGIRRLIADLLSPLPRIFRTCHSEPAREIVARLRPETFDAVFAFRVDFAHFAGVLGHPRFCSTSTIPSISAGAANRSGCSAGKVDWRSSRDLDKVGHFEKRAVRGAVASFVCQEHDRGGFEPLPIVVPNCVDVPPACPRRRALKPRIIFIGNFAAAGSANVDGLNWFLEEVWPRVRAEVPDSEFHVVGRLSSELQSRLRAVPGVVAGGFVDDLAAAMAEASLSIAPIRFGTGTRVKIIESFALGCPVVSTTLGAEGIDAAPGTQILIGDTPADFAQRCISLLRDSSEQARIAAAGYEVADGRYNEERRRRELVATLTELVRPLSSGQSCSEDRSAGELQSAKCNA